jgi:hypothetical protein
MAPATNGLHGARSASTGRSSKTTPDLSPWEKLSKVGAATARQIGTRLLYGYTVAEISRGLRIPESSVRSLVAELELELSESVPSGDDLKILARRL